MCEWKVDQCEERESLITAERGHLHLLLKDDRYNFMEATLQLVFPRSFCCHAVNLSVLGGGAKIPQRPKVRIQESRGQRRGEDETVR